MSKKTASLSLEGLKVSDRVLALATAISADLKIGDGGVADAPKDLFEKNLPDGVTMADVKRVDNARTEFVNASLLALGQVAVPAFTGNKDLQQVSLSFQSNKDKCTLQIDRERKFPNRMGGKDAPDIVRNLHSNVSYKMKSVGGAGDYGRIKSHLHAQGASIFS